jgi:hypothetical protein
LAQLSTVSAAPRARPLVGWPAPLGLFLATALLYAINLDHPPHPDELYHLLAARGLLEHGLPRIADGVYTRVYLLTWLLARAFALLGESLAVARLPSLLAMAATVTLLFLWLRAEAGRAAAWLAAGLLAVSPFAVDIAQFARFYALQTLAFTAGGLALYRAAAPAMQPGRRLALLALAAALLAFATYLQVTTLIGLAGLGLWALLAAALPWLRDPAVPPGRRRLALLAALAAAILALAALAAGGQLETLWARYRWTPLFNRDQAGSFWYYHFWYNLYYPSLWPLTPLLALAAIAAHPRLGLLAASLLAPALLLHSLAAPKSLRYVIYLQPFLFLLWGLALAWLGPRLRRLAADLLASLAPVVALPPPWPERLAKALLAGGLLFLLLANTATIRTAAMLAGITVPPELPPTRWDLARPALEPRLREAEIVLTTAELETLYFLGDYDMLVSASRLSEMAERQELAPDPRTGRPVIATAASLAAVLDCYATGLVVSPRQRWAVPSQLAPELAELLAARAEPLPLPPASRLVAYAWRHPPAAPRPEACAELPAPRRAGPGA